MNRRNILTGLGAAAVGSSIVLGSGAFAQVSADRSVTIRIDEDSEALLELSAGDPAAAEENAEGELAISTDNFGGALNEHAEVEIGTTGEDEFGSGAVETPAFTVTNNFEEAISVTLDLQDFDTSGTFRLVVTGSDPNREDILASNNGSSTFDLEEEETLEIAIEIETTDAGSDFDGTLEVTAEPSGGN